MAHAGPGRDYALKVPQMQEARRLYEQEKWSQQEIADRFGVSRAAVQNAFAYMGVRPRGQLEGQLLRYRRKSAPQQGCAA